MHDSLDLQKAWFAKNQASKFAYFLSLNCHKCMIMTS